MALMTGRGDWASDLIRAFGEDPSMTRAFTLHVDVDSVVTAVFEKYVDDKTAITEIIKRVVWVEEDKVTADAEESNR